jgi:hypothetical protein
MRCRHTVPDWHRYVAAKEDAAPILAACRLLVRDGDPVEDPRSIACTYWGHQRDCPVYDGPGQGPWQPLTGAGRPADQDVPLASEGAWPVRAPGAVDGSRIFLILMGGLSIVLLGLVAILGVTGFRGAAIPSGYRTVLTIVGVVSLLTHILTLLRIWARR